MMEKNEIEYLDILYLLKIYKIHQLLKMKLSRVQFYLKTIEYQL